MADEILLLDDDDDFLASVAELIELVLQRACVPTHSLEEMVALGSRALESSLAILDINLGAEQPSGLDAYVWLRRQQYRGRIVFLTGHARTHPLVHQAILLGDAQVVGKPITVDEMKHIINGGEHAAGQ
jgi:ActR/RegA family two-component response regulator